MFVRAAMVAYGEPDRRVWVVDSFQGLPPSTQSVDADVWSEFEDLQVSQQEVQGAFEAYNLYDRKASHGHHLHPA